MSIVQAMMGVVAQQPAGGATNGLLNGLQHYWKLDSNGTDAHGSIDLTASNIGWDTSVFIGGTASANGNGSNSSLANTTSQDIGIGNAWTYAMWFYPDSADTSLQVIAELRNRNTDLNNFIQIRKEATTKKCKCLFYNSAGTYVKDYTSTNALTDNAWNYIVWTRDGTNLKYYINGTEDTTVTKTSDLSATMTNTNRKITIGNDRGTTGTNEVDGRMDEIGLWDVALTSSDISNLYNSGSGLFYDDFTS